MEFNLAYEPREAFVPFHQRENRFSAMVCHRRAGKTVSCIGELVIRAMYTKKKRGEYAYVGPYRSQAKKVAWAYLKEFTEDLRVGNPRESDLSVTLHTGATITLYGADNPDAYEESTWMVLSLTNMETADLHYGARSYYLHYSIEKAGQYSLVLRKEKTISSTWFNALKLRLAGIK